MEQSENPELKFGRLIVGVLLVGCAIFVGTIWMLMSAQVSPWMIRLGAGVIFVGSVTVSVAMARR